MITVAAKLSSYIPALRIPGSTATASLLFSIVLTALPCQALRHAFDTSVAGAAGQPELERFATAGLRVELDANQHATVAGRSASVKTLIEELCWRAGIELLSYDAEDRPFGGNYHDLPLARAFERILVRESFVFGMRRGSE